MGVIGRVGMAAGLLCAATIAWGMQDVLHEESPETGSSIQRVAITWPVSIDKTYAELSADERDYVRNAYVKLGPGDEPPYPAYGMTGVLHDIAAVRNAYYPDEGVIHLAVRVDASGRPLGVGVLKAPDAVIAKAFAFIMMHTTYKPALCAGQPCAGDYAFIYDFAYRRPANSISTWPAALWNDRRHLTGP